MASRFLLNCLLSLFQRKRELETFFFGEKDTLGHMQRKKKEEVETFSSLSESVFLPQMNFSLRWRSSFARAPPNTSRARLPASSPRSSAPSPSRASSARRRSAPGSRFPLRGSHAAPGGPSPRGPRSGAGAPPRAAYASPSPRTDAASPRTPAASAPPSPRTG